MTARKAPRPRRSDPRTTRPTAGGFPGFPLGTTGRSHPPLGLGLWAMGRWTKDFEARTRATLEHALERGVPWVDTAEVYGNGRSERILGDVLASHPELPRPFITTKVSWEHLRPAQVRAALTQSLARLGRPSVEVYLVHAPDPNVPIGPTMEAMEALWKEGRVGAVGVSNFSVEELVEARAALREAPLVVNQVKYSLLNRTDGDAVREYCRDNSIAIEAYTPLARGLLAGRYLTAKTVPAEVRRFARDLFEVDRFPEVQARARALHALAEEAKVPLASIALHWLYRQGAAPVFGASRPEQVDQVLAAWAVRPPDEVLDKADALSRE